MKYLIASDLHGSFESAKDLLRRALFEGAEKVILLGDIYNHGPRNPLPQSYSPMDLAELLNQNKDLLIVIRGNCDCEADEMISDFKFKPSLKLKAKDKNILLTHGHKINLQSPPGKDIDILIFGHNHQCFITKKGKTIFAAVGSASLPKNGAPKSYAVLDDSSITIKDICGRTIDSINF